jgi:hypothetical protein
MRSKLPLKRRNSNFAAGNKLRAVSVLIFISRSTLFNLLVPSRGLSCPMDPTRRAVASPTSPSVTPPELPGPCRSSTACSLTVAPSRLKLSSAPPRLTRLSRRPRRLLSVLLSPRISLRLSPSLLLLIKRRLPARRVLLLRVPPPRSREAATLVLPRRLLRSLIPTWPTTSPRLVRTLALLLLLPLPLLPPPLVRLWRRSCKASTEM